MFGDLDVLDEGVEQWRTSTRARWLAQIARHGAGSHAEVDHSRAPQRPAMSLVSDQAKGSAS